MSSFIKNIKTHNLKVGLVHQRSYFSPKSIYINVSYLDEEADL